MKNHDLFGLPAALALLGLSTTAVASAIAVPAETLEAELEFGGELSGEEARRLRAFLRSRGILTTSTPLFTGVLYLPLLLALRLRTMNAEACPGRRGEGLAFAAFSHAWRLWLRVSGQGHRIRSRVNDVSPVADEAAE